MSPPPASTIPAIVRRRLIRGLGATFLTPLSTAAIQLGTVPLLLHAWGAPKYGAWLLLSAIPSYLSLSDLGFGDVSSSEMTIQVAANDRDGALETFQSSWLLLTCISTFVLGIFLPSVWLFPWHEWLKLSRITNTEIAEVVALLAVYTVVSQQSGVLESGYRCDGNFAFGSSMGTLMRLIEAVIATAAGVLTGNLLVTASSYLAVRTITTLTYWRLLRRKTPWLSLGTKYASLKTVRRLAAPALGFIALPAGYAMTFQGFTIVIGAILGPVAVVAFSTTRTLTRVNYQLLSAIDHAFWPELSVAFGSGNIPLVRNLLHNALRVGLVLSILGSSVFYFAGPTVYRLWTRNAVPFDSTCFHILLVAAAASALWHTSATVAMSKNAHVRVATVFLFGACISLALAGALAALAGTPGAALAILSLDVGMCVYAFHVALQQVQESFWSMLVSLFKVPSLSSLLPKRRIPESFQLQPVLNGEGEGCGCTENLQDKYEIR